MLRVDPEKLGPSRPVDSVSMRLESFRSLSRFDSPSGTVRTVSHITKLAGLVAALGVTGGELVGH